MHTLPALLDAFHAASVEAVAILAMFLAGGGLFVVSLASLALAFRR